MSQSLPLSTLANPLDNSAPFDVHRWSSYPEVKAAVDAIYDEIRDSFKSREKLKKRHIKVVILDLYVKWLTDPSMYAAYFRNRNAYKAKSRYNELHVSNLLPKVVDALILKGYIDGQNGFFNRVSGVSRMARMRATPKLIDLIQNKGIKPEMIENSPEREMIILREKDDDDDKQRDLEYEDTPETVRWRQQLKPYNALLASTAINVPGYPAWGAIGSDGKTLIKLDRTNKFVRRIFANGSWDKGGRFYGGFWQRIPRDWRKAITINGQRTVELDYSGMHIVLLYAEEGIDYPTEIGGDPYRLDGVDDVPKARSIAKLTLLTALNCDNELSACRAISKKIREMPLEYGSPSNPNTVAKRFIDALSAKHPQIAHHFYSGAWTRLQRLESEIAYRVIELMTLRGLPVLTIHDSFIVDHNHCNYLETYMRDIYRIVSPNGGNIDINIK